jgi:fido (protein-threonine AMPylation protein)
MFLLLPELISLDKRVLDDIDSKMKQINRLVIFSRTHKDDDLLDTYLESMSGLRELLSIKNAQMEAQTDDELIEYEANLKVTLNFIVNEITAQRSFDNVYQIFELIKLIAPDVHQQCPNRFRDKIVQVGAHLCPEPALLNGLIENLFYNLSQIKEPVIKAVYLHHELIRIHPFSDGNGRLSRMAKNWILMFDLYPPIFISDVSERKQYINALKNSFLSMEKDPFSFSEATRAFFDQEIERLSINTSLVYEKVFKMGQ